MIKLNMLPDVKREYIHARQLEAKVITGAVLASIVAAGLVVLLALWVYGAQTLHKNSLTNAIKENSQELSQIKDIDKYVTIQNQFTHIGSLHEKKQLYSRLFGVLSTLNPAAPNNVRITKVTIDSAENTMIFDGETASFTALETFRDTLKNAGLGYSVQDETKNEKLFSEVTVNNQAIGKNERGAQVVTFNLKTVYSPATFLTTSKNVIVTVPNKETTQSKVDAPDVFTGQTGGN